MQESFENKNGGLGGWGGRFIDADMGLKVRGSVPLQVSTVRWYLETPSAMVNRPQHEAGYPHLLCPA